MRWWVQDPAQSVHGIVLGLGRSKISISVSVITDYFTYVD